jgi:hypothetical protein
MGMTNAERQARYRERQRARLLAPPGGDQAATLRAVLVEWHLIEPADAEDIAEAERHADGGVRELRHLLKRWMQDQGLREGEDPAEKVRALLSVLVPVPTDADYEAELAAGRRAAQQARAAERKRRAAGGE